jgi:hypothetical protein
MRTLTIDLLNEKAMALLRDLELLKLIRLRKDKDDSKASTVNLVAKYKGAMSRQSVSVSDVDKQLKDIRNEWE